MNKPAADDSQGAALRNLSDAKIMLLDDDYMMNEVVQTYLQESGYRQVIASSEPRTALEAIRRENPDLLLLDLMMPEVSGFDVLTAIRADEQLKYLPVIVLTAAADSSNKLKALEAGASEFLAKPVDPSELVIRVRNSLAVKVYHDHIAYSDAVTGLPNRSVFMRRMGATIERAERDDRMFALLTLDLDRFKQVNETLGHHVGDHVLSAVAQRLNACLRGSDVVVRIAPQDQVLARTGGDEFAVLLPDLGRSHDAYQVTQRLLKAIAVPLNVDSRELFVTASAGIAVFPGDGSDSEGLLKNAESALTQAKQNGRDRAEFYRRELNEASLGRLDLESELHRAVERNELRLCYQPKVDIATGVITGVEALVRWQHPGRGLVSPAEFITIAEETGLIKPIGEWVIAEACRQGAAWAGAGLRDIAIAVNVSGVQMADDAILRVVDDALRRTGFAPDALVLEMTESTLMREPASVLSLLAELKKLGVSLSIDDFGTGYSSLSYLKQFPLDELKIDRSFVCGLPDDSTDVSIVRAILALARSLGLRVIAEGVETDRQLASLRSLECATFQGYLCSPPLPAGQLLTLAMGHNAGSAFRAA